MTQFLTFAFTNLDGFCNSCVDSGLLCDITSEIDWNYGGRRADAIG
jgi:hypothetical protein